MRLIEHKKGYLYGAANREGESYTDWRAPYIDRSGLLMIYESNSRPGKFVFVFFTAPASGFAGHYLKTSPGDLETEDDGIIKLTTGNSIYRFGQDDSCIHGEEMKLLLWDIYEEFGPSNSIRQVMEKELHDARLLIYEGDDHFAYNNQLARFVTACEAFLEGVDAV